MMRKNRQRADAGLPGLVLCFLMLVAIAESACAQVEEAANFDVFDEGSDLDWPDRVYLRAATTPPPSDLQDHWLGKACETLGRCYVERFMKRAKVCRLFVLKGGTTRLDIAVDSNGACRTMNGFNKGDGRYRLASVTKSVVSLLLGMTLEEDFEAESMGLDVPAKEALAAVGIAYNSKANLAQLLQMGSGMKGWDETDAEVDGKIKILEERSSGQIQGRPAFARLKDRVRYYAGREKFGRDFTFNYSSFDSTILGILVAHRLEKAGVSKGLAGGLDALIWQPMKMTRDLQWKSDFSKSQPGFCCIKAHPHDMAKLGRWVLERYREGEAVNAGWMARWVRRSIDDKVDTDTHCDMDGKSFEFGYGYQWWILPGEPFGFTARGRQGQFLHIIPELDLVIVQFSHFGAKLGGWQECQSYRLHREIAAALK